MVTVLDGGMGQELIRRAGQATPLWSIQALLDTPEMVRDVHQDFFDAGAEMATTNSYSLLPDRLAHHGLSDAFEDLHRLTCELACAARDAHGRGLVFGAMGPIGFSYRPDLAPPADVAAEVYARIARVQAPYVDGHLLETMASVDQALGGVLGASVTGKPVWLAVSVDDEDGTLLRSGEPIVDILPLVAELSPAALLVNCSRPEAVSQAIEALKGCPVPLGAYANGFVRIEQAFDEIGATVDTLDARTDLSPEAYLRFAKTWAEGGATLIGGCCEVGPAHIAALSSHFKEAA